MLRSHSRTASVPTVDSPGVSRRALLKAGGVGAALTTIAGPFGRLETALASPAARHQSADEGDGGEGAGAADADDPTLALEDIQGNVVGGFSKDFQRLLFFRFSGRRSARRWLGTLVDDVATASEVLAFNELFRRSRARRGSERTAPTARWVNVALTHAGLAALAVARDELGEFPDAFRQGMAARLMQSFVITTGGAYFLQPSLAALRRLGTSTGTTPAPLRTWRIHLPHG